tara:strand:+ start:796 stop:1593 length:798 start_codon:yes stop_codon:yes gene_type:complete
MTDNTALSNSLRNEIDEINLIIDFSGLDLSVPQDETMGDDDISELNDKDGIYERIYTIFKESYENNLDINNLKFPKLIFIVALYETIKKIKSFQNYENIESSELKDLFTELFFIYYKKNLLKLKYIEYIINIGNFIPGVSLVSTILSFTIKSIESQLEIIKPFFKILLDNTNIDLQNLINSNYTNHLNKYKITLLNKLKLLNRRKKTKRINSNLTPNILASNKKRFFPFRRTTRKTVRLGGLKYKQTRNNKKTKTKKTKTIKNKK